MKKWLVTYIVDVTKSVVVEADTEEEARELADAAIENPHICHQCSDEMEVGDVQDIHSVDEL